MNSSPIPQPSSRRRAVCALLRPARLAIAASLLAALVAGCASTKPAAPGTPYDPYESFNRKIFAFNDTLDRHVMLPIATFYRHAAPQPLRSAVHNVLANFNMPITIGNDLLQADFKRTGEAVGRLCVNSTLGIGGLMDVATRFGIPNDTADLGQTLGIYGLTAGPYLVLPLVGPTSPRDFSGDIGDHYLDPLTYVDLREKSLWMLGKSGLSLLDERERTMDETKTVRESAIDYYATIRSLYMQDREAKIRKGKPDLENLEDY